MAKYIDINVGELAAAGRDTSIRTSGIGSCIVVCLYDEKMKVGGMIHAMLPTRFSGGKMRTEFTTGADRGAVAKYVDEGIDRLVKEVENMGGAKHRMIAKLVGGSKMFKFVHDNSTGIGEQNIEMAMKKLAEYNIPVDNEDVGGTVGRMAELNVDNGVLNISIRI